MKILLSILSLLIVSVVSQQCGFGTLPFGCNKIVVLHYSGNLTACDKRVPTYTNDCKPDCKPVPCTNVTVTCPTGDVLPACTDDIPRIDDNFCISCKPDFGDCKVEKLPSCKGEGYNISNGCPTCIPVSACKVSTIPSCKDGEKPTFNGVCPSCLPIFHCDKVCATSASNIRACVADEVPSLNKTTCCETCVVRLPVCTAEKLAKCNETIQSLSYCTGDKSMMKDFSNCCVSGCKCALPTGNSICKASDLQKCQDTPVCAPKEIPCINEGSCCASCRRTASIYRPEIVAKCLVNRRHCDDDEEPVDLDSEPCESCVRIANFSSYVDEFCNATDKILVVEWDWTKGGVKLPIKKHCVSKKILSIVLKAVDDISTVTIQFIRDNLDNHDAVYLYLQSIFDRACAFETYKHICRIHRANFKNIRIAELNIDIDLKIKIEVPDEHFQLEEDFEFSVSTSKRALLQGSAADSVQQITTDPTVNDVSTTTTASTPTGPTSTTSPSSTGSPNPNSPNFGSTFVVSFALIALCLLTLF